MQPYIFHSFFIYLFLFTPSFFDHFSQNQEIDKDVLKRLRMFGDYLSRKIRKSMTRNNCVIFFLGNVQPREKKLLSTEPRLFVAASLGGMKTCRICILNGYLWESQVNFCLSVDTWRTEDGQTSFVETANIFLHSSRHAEHDGASVVDTLPQTECLMECCCRICFLFDDCDCAAKENSRLLLAFCVCTVKHIFRKNKCKWCSIVSARATCQISNAFLSTFKDKQIFLLAGWAAYINSYI